MVIYERDSTAIEILDEDDDTRSKEAHEIIDIDAIPEMSNPCKYKRKRAVLLNHCIGKTMKSKQIRFENTKQEVILEIKRLSLTMNWITVLFLDHVPKEIVFTDTAIRLFESEYDLKVAVYYNENRPRSPSPLESLCHLMENTSGHEMIKKVNKLTSK